MANVTNKVWPQPVAGVDEVGRGPLAGAVYAAAVVLDPERPIEGLADSKKLSPKKRDILFDVIKSQAAAWSVATASVAEIDDINILHASLLAMHRAVEQLALQPAHVLVDGNKLPKWDYSATAIVGGDDSEPAIAAASIIAKVSRDRAAMRWHEQYPQYALDKHKGYPTKLHMERLREHGPCELHRRSFGPVRKLLAAELSE